MGAPCIRLRLEPINSYSSSPIRQYQSKSVEKFSMRTPYNYNKEAQALRHSTKEDYKTYSANKTASLRRRDKGQNLPMPIDDAKNIARNR